MVNRGRRRFLWKGLGSTVALAAGTGLYTWRIEPHWVEFVQRALPIANLPPALAGRTLVQLSDLHVGPRVDDDYVIGVFDRVRALAPDIVVFTGDFTENHRRMPAHARRVYTRTPLGRLATVGVLGNHDYGPGWRYPELAANLVPVLADCGIRVLRNEVADVGGLDIVGLDDLWANRFQPAAALEPGCGEAGARPQPQSGHGRRARLARIRRLDPERPHPRRPVQTAVPAAAADPGAQPALYERRDRRAGRPAALHQPRRRPHTDGAVQRTARSDGLHAAARVRHPRRPRDGAAARPAPRIAAGTPQGGPRRFLRGTAADKQRYMPMTW